VETASGINLWAEWANVDAAVARGVPYTAPLPRHDYAGLLVSLARQEWPDTSGFQDPELVWRMRKRNHVGFIVKSPERQRVAELLHLYTERVRTDFHASAPPREKPGE